MMNKKVDWLILYATDREGKGILPPGDPVKTRRNLKTYCKKNVCTGFLHIGPGAKNIINTLEEMAEEYSLHQLILAGLCGALHPGLETGQTLLANSAMTSREGISVECPERNRLSLPDSIKNLKQGLFLSVHSPADLETKKRLHQKFPEAVAVDMEAYFVMQSARQLGLPCLVLKTVADEFEDDIPADYGMNHAPDAKIKKALEANARAVRSLL